MPESDLPRACCDLVEEYLSTFRVVILNGPRQAGKTTLLGHVQARHGGTLFNLDDEQLLQAAVSDPLGFAGSGTEPRLIDEIQRAGDPLVRAIKAEVDAVRKPGRYVLAGSTRFLSTPSLSESLAGRAAVVDVWPFSQGEFEGRPEKFIDTAFDEPDSLWKFSPSQVDRVDYVERLCRGGFPEPALMHSARARRTWFRSYVRAIAERDIREMTRLNEPSAITTLLSYLASITAQEHNSVHTSNKTGLHRTTVNRYLELLEAVFLIHRLPAWSRNPTARVVKHAKVHLTDTGLAASLLGVSPESLAKPVAPARGALIETFIVNELAKQATWSDAQVRLHHWRVSGGAEVDVVLEREDGQIVGIESKARDTVTSEDFQGLAALRDQFGDQFRQGIVLHTGKRGSVNFGERLLSLPIAALWEAGHR
jgi:predicted AAA+ superfamily ATPase